MNILKSHQVHQLINALPIIWFFSGFLLVSNGQTYMAYFLLFASIYNVLSKKTSLPLERKKYLLYPLLIYILALTISYLYTRDFWPVIRTSLYFIPYLLTTSLTINTIKNTTLTLPFTAIFIISSYFYLGSERYLDYTGLNPIPLGTTLAFHFCILSLASTIFKYNRYQNIFIFLGALALIGSIIKTETRGAWLCLILILPIITTKLIQEKRTSIRKKSILWAVPILITCISILYHTMSVRIESTINEFRSISNGHYSTSIGARLELWKTSFEVISNNYYLFPALEEEIHNYFKNKYEENEIVRATYVLSGNAHNQYVNSWLRTGMIGLLSIIILTFYPLWGIIKNYGISNSALISTQTITLLVSGLTELPLTQISAYQAFLMSLLVSYMILEKKE